MGRRTKTSATGDERPGARQRWLRRVALAAAVAYLACVWLDAVGTSVPAVLLPRPLLFFVQIAQLFPRAAIDAIEWRARGYRCEQRRFEELDLAPYFPIHAGDKENRFDRALFFYLEDKRVLAALDAFISDAEAKRGNRIGGVMILSLRTPIPEPGTQEPRYRRVPVDQVPPSTTRRYWYVTGAAERAQRCGEAR